MIEANVLEVGIDNVRAIAPEGEERFPVTPEALASARVTRGAGVMLDCAVGPDGALLVERIQPHTGLPITYGTVAVLSQEQLVLDSPLGAETFVVNAWSDLPAAIKPGQFVGVKHYGMDDARTVLNAKPFPGMVEASGVVTGFDGEHLSTATLGGPATYDVAGVTGLPEADVQVGKTVTVKSRRSRDGLRVSSVAIRDDDLLFTGKMSSWDPAKRLFAMVDAWGGVLGVVRFRWQAGCDAGCGVVPGDLADVHYRFDDDGFPVIQTLQKRAISPVFFGEINEIDTRHVTLTTLQHQVKTLDITLETRQPLPIHVGDFADVIHGPDGTQTAQRALAIVKE